MIYQHASTEADHSIASAIDKAVKAARRKPSTARPKKAVDGDESAASS